MTIKSELLDTSNDSQSAYISIYRHFPPPFFLLLLKTSLNPSKDDICSNIYFFFPSGKNPNLHKAIYGRFIPCIFKKSPFLELLPPFPRNLKEKKRSIWQKTSIFFGVFPQHSFHLSLLTKSNEKKKKKHERSVQRGKRTKQKKHRSMLTHLPACVWNLYYFLYMLFFFLPLILLGSKNLIA